MTIAQLNLFTPEQETTTSPRPTGTGTHTMRNLPKGWRFRTTPGHGYLHPAADDNRNVPSKYRSSSYEEDCAWAIPVAYNPHLFSPEFYQAALDTLMHWEWEIYEAITGTVIQPGESRTKDEDYWTPLNNQGKWKSRCAFGDWHEKVPKGQVYCLAQAIPTAIKQGNKYTFQESKEHKAFLIPAEEYRPGVPFDEFQYPLATFEI